MSATSSAMSTVIVMSVSAYSANGRSVTTTTRSTMVRPASRIDSAISFGVLRREAPSTSAIMRSMNDCPGSCVISTTMRSDSTRVPPVTALRSPPDSRMTGADSPVIADSSTDAMPSTTVPSPGISSPASTTTMSPRTSSDAAFAPPSRSRAVVSLRIARSVAAWALPRPSAIASAKLPKSTVSHSQTATVNANQPAWPVSPAIHMTVVSSAPISTTNITGFAIIRRGSSLRNDPATAVLRMAGSKSERSGRSVIGRSPDRGRG
jgi:hypothetical protein